MSEYEIFIPKTLNSDYSNLCELYQQVNNILFNLTAHDEVIFNFEKIRWINAEMTAFLGMIFSAVNAKGAFVYAKVENLSLKSKEILLKNGFLKNFGIDHDLEDIYGTTIPFFRSSIKEIEKIDEYIDEDLLKHIRNKTSEEFLGEIKESLLEVIHNVRDHSQSEVIYMCGQHYPRKPEGTNYGTISFAISDNGIGLIENIKSKNHNFPNVKKYFDWAFDKGNSTKSRYDSGIGLYELRKKLHGKGEITVVANNGYHRIDSFGTVDSGEFSFNIPGTFVVIKFFLDNCQKSNLSDTMDLSGLLNEWFV